MTFLEPYYQIVQIKMEVEEILNNEPNLSGLRKLKDPFCNSQFLLNNTKELYELSIKDKYLDYPFLKDETHPDPLQKLAEHERIANYIYSTNLLYFNSYSHLCKLYFNYLQPLLEANNVKKHISDIGFRLRIGDFMINICSSLDVLSMMVCLIQGFPIDVFSSNMKKIIRLLKSIRDRDNSTFVRSLSDDCKNISVSLYEEILPLLLAENDVDWVDEIYNYRNYLAHKNFMAVVVSIQSGKVYLPQQPNTLPSIINNTDDQTALRLCHNLPLDEYCVDRYQRVRKLIEKTFQCLSETYYWRLNNPDLISNPHVQFRRLNSPVT